MPSVPSVARWSEPPHGPTARPICCATLQLLQVLEGSLSGMPAGALGKVVGLSPMSAGGYVVERRAILDQTRGPKTPAATSDYIVVFC